MKYCEHGNHRFHLRPMLVEKMHGDSGWLCIGKNGWKPKRKARKRKAVK